MKCPKTQVYCPKTWVFLCLKFGTLTVFITRLAMQTILLIGLGKIGKSVAQTLLAQGKIVIGVTRHFTDIAQTLSQSPNFAHLQADASQLTPAQIQPFSQAITHVCIIVSPSQSSDQFTTQAYQAQAYKNSYLAICETIARLSPHLPRLQRVVFISSTSIYGHNSGEVIDATTPMQSPPSATAKILLQAEMVLAQQFGEKCTLIRPSGIYGRDRLRLIKMVENLANGTMALPPNSWTNRIFDTDLIKIIVNVLNENQPLPVYLATDNLPVPLYEVLGWLAGEMALRVALPTTRPIGGKRLCHNLPEGWLEYGDFKQGYRVALEHFSVQ